MKGPIGGMPADWTTLHPNERVVMLAAGTGITPMLQILYGWVELFNSDKMDQEVRETLAVDLALFNKDVESIPMQSHLQALVQQMPVVPEQDCPRCGAPRASLGE
jgi:ferredoxin-NADP reductase